MANIIALAIFIVSFAGIAFLVFRKLKDLVNLPEEALQVEPQQSQIKQNILQKTALIQQAVLHNKKVEAVMAKATGRFKTVFASRTATQEEMEKVEKIHQEGDYWQKVEQHKFAPTPNRNPVSNGASKKTKAKKKKENPLE